MEAAAAGLCSAWMSLWGPGDQVSADDCVPGEFQVALPVSGTYVLTVAGIGFLSDLAYALQANTSALRAADVSACMPAGPSAASLTDAALAALWAEAQSRWSLAGVGGSALRIAVSRVRLSIDDLPDGGLGLATRNTMHVDRDAASPGWFVDDTPWDDDEFDYLTDRHSFAAGCFDLLTVLMHELGHLLGATHADNRGHSLLDDLLPVGHRRAPTGADYDAWFQAMGKGR